MGLIFSKALLARFWLAVQLSRMVRKEISTVITKKIKYEQPAVSMTGAVLFGKRELFETLTLSRNQFQFLSDLGKDL